MQTCITKTRHMIKAAAAAVLTCRRIQVDLDAYH